MNGRVELAAGLRLHGERFVEHVDAVADLEAFDQALAQQEQALLFATGRPAVRMGLGQVAEATRYPMRRRSGTTSLPASKVLTAPSTNSGVPYSCRGSPTLLSTRRTNVRA